MGETIKSFEDLLVWQESHKLMIDAYGFADRYLPPEEKYNRISQIKRCSSSIPANIAEGYGRFHFLENIQYCRQARGSLDELKNHIIAARDLKQAPPEECAKFIQKCNYVRAILNNYINKTHDLYIENKQK
ncbi:MAG: four helix bundle protein [Patescibacteria group bacterium]|nr:four helix bundle protein [Patescibacteria group bacterium]